MVVFPHIFSFVDFFNICFPIVIIVVTGCYYQHLFILVYVFFKSLYCSFHAILNTGNFFPLSLSNRNCRCHLTDVKHYVSLSSFLFYIRYFWFRPLSPLRIIQSILHGRLARYLFLWSEFVFRKVSCSSEVLHSFFSWKFSFQIFPGIWNFSFSRSVFGFFLIGQFYFFRGFSFYQSVFWCFPDWAVLFLQRFFFFSKRF